MTASERAKSIYSAKESFDTIFGSAKLIYFASVTAYFIGSLSDIYIFGVIKRYTKGRFLWLRAVGGWVTILIRPLV